MSKKQKSHWLNPLAILTLTTVAWSNSTLANEANPTTIASFSPATESIEIYVPPPEKGNTGVCAALIEPAIKSIIGIQSNSWGILVETLNERTTIYSHNADKYFIPASNIKIFTTAAALQKLNPQTAIRSKSLKDWITVTNQRSVNSYADMLMNYIGGTQAAKAALTQLGVDPNSYRLADGSGLSRHNVATPRAIVATLRAIHFASGSEVFHASLPVAGISGTLRNRLRWTPAQGIVYAKTGTLTGVRALSGYINHPSYGMLVFSILVNQSNQSGDALVRSIDNIVLQLSQLAPCE
ncbi:MAG: D-alanyl-D-alanine carboxypeptidase/D-alanyl-D-alanine endopeptidase [Microcystaceae cyanobacterium]